MPQEKSANALSPMKSSCSLQKEINRKREMGGAGRTLFSGKAQRFSLVFLGVQREALASHNLQRQTASGLELMKGGSQPCWLKRLGKGLGASCPAGDGATSCELSKSRHVIILFSV